MEKKDLKFSATYTSINKYVDQLYDGFIASVVGKVRTLDFITIIPDVKYSKVVPTVDTAFCGTPAAGTTNGRPAVSVAASKNARRRGCIIQVVGVVNTLL